MADTPGTLLGHYRIVGPIGTGGFATVYRAIDERFDTDVAIKMLADNHALDPEVRERFLEEGRLLRRANSASVIAVHDIGETDRGQPFLVLSFADRGDLRTRTAEVRQAGGAPSASDVQLVGETLAIALRGLHQAGVVHRDVKPDNLLITSSGGPSVATALFDPGERLLLSDLGYAKDLGRSSGLTVGGGTHGFNAPEQRVGMSQVDQRADVYGASAALYWLLLGQPPPEDPGYRDELLTSAAALVGDQVVAAIDRGLAADPDDRFDTIDQWHGALITDGAGDEASTPVVTWASAAVAAPAADRGGRRRISLGGVLVGAVGLACLVLVGLSILGLVTDRAWWDVTGSNSQTITTLDDGRIQVERQSGDLQLAIFGPATLAVGESARFEAAAVGATDLTWITPDGLVVDDPAALVVSASRVGEGRVTLIGSDARGGTVSVELIFQVIDPE